MSNNQGSTKAVINAMTNPDDEHAQLELPIGINDFDWADFVKCECGCDKVGSHKHSDYCPKFKTGDNDNA